MSEFTKDDEKLIDKYFDKYSTLSLYELKMAAEKLSTEADHYYELADKAEDANDY